MYPKWARDYVFEGYTYSTALPKKELDDYLEADTILPGLNYEDYVYGYVPPTNGRAPFYVIFINGLYRAEVVEAFKGVGYEFRTSFKYYDYLMYGQEEWSIKVCDLCEVETTSQETTITPIQTQINFYKAEDVPNAIS